MKLRLENIDTLLRENGKYSVRRTDIYIDGDSIASVGEAPAGFVPERIISGKDRLAIPGLNNCHTHSYMSLYRNLADDLPFEKWLFDCVMKYEDMTNSEEAYWGAMLACMEMLKTGTVSFIDMHMFPDMTCGAAAKVGMRGVMARGLVGDGRKDPGTIRRIKEAEDEYEKWRGNPLITAFLAPHAIYTTATEAIEWIIEEAKRLNLPLCTHVSETKNEVDTSMKLHGMSPVKYLDSLGFFDRKSLVAHAVHVDDEDIDIFAKKGVYVATCPKSNMKLGNGFAPLGKMLEKGVKLCIGTDSASSNNSLNLFSEMNIAALVHKGLLESPIALGADTILDMATLSGAKALRLESGEIKAGLKADVVLLDLNRPEFCPRKCLDKALVYSASGTEVDTVIVNGEIVLENGHLTKADEEEIYYNVNRIAEKFC